MHRSIRLEQHPVEFINITPVNPLISKCQIKVCYVSDEPNRNKSIITKEVARDMANSLPGSPIVGYYNEEKGDFEEHNRIIDISNGKFVIKDTTRPYGFVDLNAKVWFAKYLDDDEVEREYLVTEGWLWTGQYPECRRILDKGNNHSMELDEDHLDAAWSFDKNGKPKFFIINEAIISKLCVLGEVNEPCFEGSNITPPTIQFSIDESFTKVLYSMMNELKELLQEGGAKKVFTRYAVEIGDALWTALYSHVDADYENAYRIDGIYEEGDQKFAVLQHRSDMKCYRLNFSMSEEVFSAEPLTEITDYSIDEANPQFAQSDIETFETEYAEKKKKKEEEEDKKGEEDKNNSDKSSEGENKDDDANDDDDEEEKKKKKKKEFSKEEEKCPECGKPVEECTCGDENKKKEYSLEEIPEYNDLMAKYSELEGKYNDLLTEKNNLEAQLAPLSEFKAQAERKDKEAMINSFYMLSDEDKQDVVTNIDTYSLDDIEAKLSVICVRNKVSFNLEDDDNKSQEGNPTVFNLNSGEDEFTPAWVKRAMSVAKTLN